MMYKLPLISSSAINEIRDIFALSLAVYERDLKARIIFDLSLLSVPLNLLLHPRFKETCYCGFMLCQFEFEGPNGASCIALAL
ncbi:hypothetical protein LguiA_003846 [Lonicera macranthoides]